MKTEVLQRVQKNDMFNLPQLSVWQAVLQAAPFEACIRGIKDTAKSWLEMECTGMTWHDLTWLPSLLIQHISSYFNIFQHILDTLCHIDGVGALSSASFSPISRRPLAKSSRRRWGLLAHGQQPHAMLEPVEDSVTYWKFGKRLKPLGSLERDWTSLGF